MQPRPIDLSTSTASLAPLKHLVAERLLQVNARIMHETQSDIALIQHVATHLIQAGGKRLRPSLTLACANLCHEQGDRSVALATCVEFIHTATLLHDDVVDESNLRRGEATANAVWGNQASVLVGDFLLSRAFEMMVEDGSLDVLAILSHAATIIAQGEVQQLMLSHDVHIQEANYLDIIGAKTAALFAAACELGGVVGKHTNARSALKKYGYHVGMAFQLIDDALDYEGDANTMGKTVGDDFLEGKMTLPLIHAYQQGNATMRAFFERCVQTPSTIASNDLTKACQLIQTLGGLDYTKNLAEYHATQAKAALACFETSEAKCALIDTAEFSVQRGY